VDEAERAVLGYEYLADEDVVAAGAAQPDRVPHVLDRVVGARQQEGTEINRPVFLVGDDLAEKYPGRVIAAGGEAPPAADQVTAVGLDRLAGRRVGGRDPGGLVAAPDLLLSFGREQPQMPGVHAENGGHPAGRSARAG